VIKIADIEAILIIDIKSGMPLFSKIDNEEIDDALVSGFISAITSFSKEMALGSLSSLITNEKTLYIVARQKILVALITSKEQDFERVYSLGIKIAEAFEHKFPEDITSPETEKYESFEKDLEEILKETQTPFIIKVAKFIKKEYGGELSITPILTTKTGKKVKIDIISDRGKKKPEHLRAKIVTKLFKGFTEDVVFVKVIEGVAGKGEVQEFIELMQEFGIKKEEGQDTEVFPYFPSYCVIVAEDFSPTVKEYLDTLEKEDGKPYIPGTHINRFASLKTAPDIEKCFIELWKWETPYPIKLS